MSVSTTPVALSTSAWTDLGPGPMMIGANGARLAIAIADTQPALATAGFGLDTSDGPAHVPRATHVWALAMAAGARALVAPIAPLAPYGLTPLTPGQHSDEGAGAIHSRTSTGTSGSYV